MAKAKLFDPSIIAPYMADDMKIRVKNGKHLKNVDYKREWIDAEEDFQRY